MSRSVFALAAAIALGACGADEPDLKQELQELSKDLRGRVDPLPQLRSVEAMPYRAGNLPDPFYPAEKKQR